MNIINNPDIITTNINEETDILTSYIKCEINNSNTFLKRPNINDKITMLTSEFIKQESVKEETVWENCDLLNLESRISHEMNPKFELSSNHQTSKKECDRPSVMLEFVEVQHIKIEQQDTDEYIKEEIIYDPIRVNEELTEEEHDSNEEKLIQCNVHNHCDMRGKSCMHCDEFSREHNLTHNSEKYICKYCNKVISKPNHQIEYIKIDTGEIPINKSDELKKHISFCTLQKSFKQSEHSNKQIKEDKRHKCIQCNKSFTKSINLKTHIMTHSNKQTFNCTQCNKIFARSSELKNHMTSHTSERPYKCSQCEMAFKQSKHLHKHFKRHSGDQPHKCKDCNKVFRQLVDLTKHMETHTSIKPYRCEKCDKSFTQSGSLAIHMRSHSDIRLYKCTECSKVFVQSEHLVKHMRTHTRERPYICNICHKGFAQSGDLKKHMVTHSDARPYICSQCQKGFKQPEVLKRHMRIHAAERS